MPGAVSTSSSKQTLSFNKDMNQTIRIKLKSYDYNLVDKSAEKIVKTVKATGAVISGPIPCPPTDASSPSTARPSSTRRAREQFQLTSYKRLIDIYNATQNRRRSDEARTPQRRRSGNQSADTAPQRIQINQITININKRNARINWKENRNDIRFQCRRQERAVHCYRSRSLCGYSG